MSFANIFLMETQEVQTFSFCRSLFHIMSPKRIRQMHASKLLRITKNKTNCCEIQGRTLVHLSTDVSCVWPRFKYALSYDWGVGTSLLFCSQPTSLYRSISSHRRRQGM